MKKILIIFCFVMVAYSIYFPFSYFKSNNDKMEIKVSHILVNTEQEAIDIKNEIQKSKKFNEMAQKYSTCSSKENNGDLGYVQRGKFPQKIEKTIFEMPLNELSSPIKSDYGWHILKITDIKYYSDKQNFKYNKHKYLVL